MRQKKYICGLEYEKELPGRGIEIRVEKSTDGLDKLPRLDDDTGGN